jgi:hypothetical protein
MPENTQESMTVEAPATETNEASAPQDTTDLSGLLNTLQKIGVDTPEKIQGVYQASQQTGRAWNEVGALRKEVDRLSRALQEKQQAPQTNPYDFTGTESVDLSKVIRDGVRDFYMEEVVRPQKEAQSKFWADQEYIQSDPDYELVKDGFNQLIGNPQTQARLSRGETSVRDEYNRVVRGFYRGVAKQSREALEHYVTKRTPSTPHVESGESHTVPLPNQDDERKETMNKIVKKRQSGEMASDAALEAILAAMLGR